MNRIVTADAAQVIWVANLSRVAARMYFPFGENLTNDTGGLSSSGKNTENHFRDQCITVLTLEINACITVLIYLAPFKNCLKAPRHRATLISNPRKKNLTNMHE